MRTSHRRQNVERIRNTARSDADGTSRNDDHPPQDDGSTGSGYALSRRDALGGIGAIAAGSVVAGCGEITSYEFRSQPATIPPDRRAPLGFDERERESITAEYTKTINGVTVDAQVESHVATYATVQSSASEGRHETALSRGASTEERSPTDPFPTSSDRFDVLASPRSAARSSSIEPSRTRSGDCERTTLRYGVVSTPDATVLGRSLNPLTDSALRNLFTRENAAVLFDRLEGCNGPLEWDRGPSPLRTQRTTVLDAETVMESFAGVAVSETDRRVIFAHASRTGAENATVIAIGVHDRPVETADGPYVGIDGFLDEAAFTAMVEAVTEANAAVVLEGNQ